MLYSTTPIAAIFARITEDCLLELGSELDDERLHGIGLSNQEWLTFCFYWKNEVQFSGHLTIMAWQRLTGWKHLPKGQMLNAGPSSNTNNQLSKQDDGVIEKVTAFLSSTYTAITDSLYRLFFGPPIREITVLGRYKIYRGGGRAGRVTPDHGYPDLRGYDGDQEKREVLWYTVRSLESFIHVSAKRKEEMFKALSLPKDALKQSQASVMAGTKRKRDMRSSDMWLGDQPWIYASGFALRDLPPSHPSKKAKYVHDRTVLRGWRRHQEHTRALK